MMVQMLKQILKGDAPSKSAAQETKKIISSVERQLDRLDLKVGAVKAELRLLNMNGAKAKIGGKP